jgi:hypothetical protein
MDFNAEDPSKKRDSAQVENGDEEKSKKVRVNRATRHRSPTPRLIAREHSSRDSSSNDVNKTLERSTLGNAPSNTHAVPQSASGESSDETNSAVTKIWDLESALLYLVQVDGEEKEYLSKNEDETPKLWVTFRVGHAGDASMIATWYRQATRPLDHAEVDIVKPADATTDPSDDDSRTSMLEVWLAEGLGDEDTPPAVHALIGYVNQEGPEKTIKTFGSVGLLTLDWKDNERVLQIQWMHINPGLEYNIAKTLEQKMWLRISTLAQMTACHAVTIDERMILACEEQQSAKNRPSPSAEYLQENLTMTWPLFGE